MNPLHPLPEGWNANLTETITYVSTVEGVDVHTITGWPGLSYLLLPSPTAWVWLDSDGDTVIFESFQRDKHLIPESVMSFCRAHMNLLS